MILLLILNIPNFSNQYLEELVYNFFSQLLSLYWYNFKNQENACRVNLSSRSSKKKEKNYRSTSKSCNFFHHDLKAGQNPFRKRHVSRFYFSSFACNHVSYPFCWSGVRSPVAWDHGRLKCRFLVANRTNWPVLKRWKRKREGGRKDGLNRVSGFFVN